MDTTAFTKTSGRLVRTAEGAAAFVPSPLPPELPPSWDLTRMLSKADRALGQLRGMTPVLPNPRWLIQPFARRDAVLSSRIEGTRATLTDLAAFEAGQNVSEQDDVREVANYLSAMEYGLELLRDLPLSLRFIRLVHERLMQDVRGGTRAPGEFRKIQNWIGRAGCTMATATYVPPPVQEMNEALDAFEKFLHASSELPPLIRLALIHYQFEAIHPFLDGNGRVGRLLITFVIHAEHLLDQPMLYLSPFFERYRSEYYELLLGVTQNGAWNHWISFFLEAITDQASDVVGRARQLLELRDEYRDRLAAHRTSAVMLAAIDQLFESPAVTIASFARQLRVTYRAAKQNVEKLVAADVLVPRNEGARNTVYVANEIIAAIEE